MCERRNIFKLNLNYFILQGSKVEAVINVAGGWAGGNAADAEWVKNADLMWKQSVE